jgi:hypothetical protein
MKIDQVHIGDTVRWWFIDRRGYGKVEKDRSHEGLVSRIGQRNIQVECEDGKPRRVSAEQVELVREPPETSISTGSD